MSYEWWVKYEVSGLPQTAGPYTSGSEADAQAIDIRGYEGVSNVDVYYTYNGDPLKAPINKAAQIFKMLAATIATDDPELDRAIEEIANRYSND